MKQLIKKFSALQRFAKSTLKAGGFYLSGIVTPDEVEAFAMYDGKSITVAGITHICRVNRAGSLYTSKDGVQKVTKKNSVNFRPDTTEVVDLGSMLE